VIFLSPPGFKFEPTYVAKKEIVNGAAYDYGDISENEVQEGKQQEQKGRETALMAMLTDGRSEKSKPEKHRN
jgi:hypothetical protein